MFQSFKVLVGFLELTSFELFSPIHDKGILTFTKFPVMQFEILKFFGFGFLAYGKMPHVLGRVFRVRTNLIHH